MHRYHLAILVAASSLCAPASADLVFSESFGVSGGGSSLDLFSGFDNGLPVAFSSVDGADVRDSSSSAGEYSGASGGNNVFLSDNTEGFTISGISTAGFSDLFLSFGGNEAVGGTTGLDNTMLTVEFSTDGATFVDVPFSAGDSNGWSSIKMSSAVGSLPTAVSLTLRLTSTVVSTQDLRIDDMAIEGRAIAAVPEPTAALLGSLLVGALGMTVARRPNSRD